MGKKITNVLLYVFLAGAAVAYITSFIVYSVPYLTPSFYIAGAIACFCLVVPLGFLLLYKTETRSSKTFSLLTNLTMFGLIIYFIIDGGLGLFSVAFNGEWDFSFTMLWLLAPPLLVAAASLAVCIKCFKRLKN